LKKCIEFALGGTVSLNNNVLYPALKHFEGMGAVVREVVPQEGKPNRHIYHLTERGSELLHTYLCDFPSECAANEAEFFTRVAFFDYLERGEQQASLQKRLAHLEGQLAYLRNLQQLADQAGIVVDAQQRVLAFQLRRLGDEHQWIGAWLEELQPTT
jgi:DNA-binding PadR family transcriptional regulator